MQQKILVLGATGYVGGRLVPKLLQQGYLVRAAGRNLNKLACREWTNHPNLELVRADVTELKSLQKAAQSCDYAYYLVHSMFPGIQDYAQKDRLAAQNMVKATQNSDLQRIIYLGGLGYNSAQNSQELSRHLRSRYEVGKILSTSSAKLTWLKAAMIIGSGSASFELLRYLVDRLPIMLTPKWVHSRCQPIAISNVLDYLIGCLDNPQTAGQCFDIGGPDILSYRQLFQIYARLAGLRPRLIIPIPILSPRLSSYWINMVTPIPASLARPLAEGLKNEVICQNNKIQDLIPLKLFSAQQAMQRALQRLRQNQVLTSWSDAGLLKTPEWITCSDAPYAGGTVLQSNYQIRLGCPAHTAWPAIASIGGHTGWYCCDNLWRIRGRMDKWIGGVGLRRGRRHTHDLQIGDALDFWRVLNIQPGRGLQLVAEMKLPGEAILELEVCPLPGNECLVTQKAKFLPKGLWGIIYWKMMYPAHIILFKGMLKNMAKKLRVPIIEGPLPMPDENAVCIWSR